ncbi:MAG: hypothetical protein AAF086_08625 [Planctomycetota bacterium]
MKRLDSEKQTARRDYRTHRYPGDLAADLGLGRPRLAGRLRDWRGVGSAAALLVLAATVWWWVAAPSPQRVVVTPDGATPIAVPKTVASPPTTKAIAPAAVGVRLTEVPPLRLSLLADRTGRAAISTRLRPRPLNLGSTPRRFPGLTLKRTDSPPPSSRRPFDEHPRPDNV